MSQFRYFLGWGDFCPSPATPAAILFSSLIPAQGPQVPLSQGTSPSLLPTPRMSQRHQEADPWQTSSPHARTLVPSRKRLPVPLVTAALARLPRHVDGRGPGQFSVVLGPHSQRDAPGRPASSGTDLLQDHCLKVWAKPLPLHGLWVFQQVQKPWGKPLSCSQLSLIQAAL